MMYSLYRLIGRTLAAGIFVVTIFITDQSIAAEEESLQAEYNRLFQDLLKSPNDLEKMSRFAYVATRLRNYEAAITTFERMLLINPNLTSVRLEIGVLYYRLKAYETAQVYLEDVLDDPSTSPTAKARAQRYLDETEERLSDSTFSGSLLAGVRYETNASQGPSSSTVLAGGFEVPTPAALAERDDVNGFVSGRVRHRLNFDSPLDEAWITDLAHYSTKQAKLDEIDVNFAELRTGPRLALFPQTVDTLFIRPFAIANVSAIDHGLFGYGYGGGVTLEKEWEDDNRVGFRYIGLIQEFDSPTVFFDDLLTGTQHRYALYVFERITEDFSFFGQIRYVDNEADSPQNAFDRYDLFVRFAQYYDPPFGFSWPWQVALHGWFIQRNYDAADPVVDPFTVRKDHEFRVGISNEFQFSRDWSIYWLLEYIQANSNIPNYEFDNLSTSVAARLRF